MYHNRGGSLGTNLVVSQLWTYLFGEAVHYYRLGSPFSQPYHYSIHNCSTVISAHKQTSTHQICRSSSFALSCCAASKMEQHSALHSGNAQIPRDPSESSVSPIPTPPQRTHSSSSLHKASIASSHSHRSSFAENLRGLPSSPRSQRHPSLTQSAIQDLINHPPPARQHNPRFAGRDWRDIAIGELVSSDDVRWVDMDTSVEDASMVSHGHIPPYPGHMTLTTPRPL